MTFAIRRGSAGAAKTNLRPCLGRKPRCPRIRASFRFESGGSAAAAGRADLRRWVADALRSAARRTLDAGTCGVIDVLVTDDEGIRALNREHRRIDRATDALAFPQFDPDEVLALWATTPPLCQVGRPLTVSEIEAAPPNDLPCDEPLPLGDIVLSLPALERQARRRKATLEAEARFVAVHAFLHLLGCDHDTPARRRSMWNFSSELAKGAS